MNDRKLYRKLKPDQNRVEINYLHVDPFRIRYADVGDIHNRMVLFIHGAPGSLEAFTRFLRDNTLRQSLRMIAVDRPGYGHSDPGCPVTSLRVQADLLLPFLNLNQHPEDPILVGHSYGGPVAASLAIRAPGQVGGILLVGAAMDPDQEKFLWIPHLIQFLRISSILPYSVVAAHLEKISHKEELKKISFGWEEIQVPVTILHGRNDWIVPVENAFFMNRVLTNARIKMVIKRNTGHLIPWTHPGLIKYEILDMIGSK